jgi:excisionase family DNA binding protein
MTQGLLNTIEAAEALRLAAGTLEKLRTYGGGPRYAKLGRAVRYRREDLDAWLSDRLIANTSEHDEEARS